MCRASALEQPPRGDGAASPSQVERSKPHGEAPVDLGSDVRIMDPAALQGLVVISRGTTQKHLLTGIQAEIDFYLRDQV
jgi:hypothetical protein